MGPREVGLEGFEPESHLERLEDWLRRRHVARWWGDPESARESLLRLPTENQAVIVVDAAAVGYVCWRTAARSELEAAGLGDLPDDLVDIDILIGEPEWLARGIGTRALGVLLGRLRSDPSVSLTGVGTSVHNERAIRAFEKAGLRRFREFEDPEFGSCLYLVADVRVCVRLEQESDQGAVRALNLSAFETSVEANLVDRLRTLARPFVSLVAELEGEVVGHILFTPVSLSGHPEARILGLAPMAVAPGHQRRGIGTALVGAGLDRCRELGFEAVVVLGHPTYYPRFGFRPAAEVGIDCEFEAPREAFLFLELAGGGSTQISGTIRYHPAFGET